MEFLVLDTNFNHITVVDNYESVIWTDRYDAYGDFELYFLMNLKLLEIFKIDYYLYNKDSEHCMIIEDLKIETDAEDGDHLIVTGRSLESILERRILWGQNIFNGKLQTAIKKMLNDSIIEPSVTDRKISNFMFIESTDTNITSLKIDNQYTGDNLYTVINGLCEENNIGFKVVLTDENKFAFSLYKGTNRAYSQIENPYVVFSPSFENLINTSYFTSKVDYKNVTLVAGEGEGAARKTATVGSGAGLDRRELYTDARDVSSNVEGGTLSDDEYVALLEARGKKKLAECTASTSFEGEIEATRAFEYGKDVFMGDIVQIVNEYGIESSAYISELIFSNDDSGLSVYPTFKNI